MVACSNMEKWVWCVTCINALDTAHSSGRYAEYVCDLDKFVCKRMKYVLYWGWEPESWGRKAVQRPKADLSLSAYTIETSEHLGNLLKTQCCVRQGGQADISGHHNGVHDEAWKCSQLELIHAL